MNDTELKRFATEIRMETVKAIANKGGGHIGGSLSIADLVAVLYGDVMRVRPQQPDWDGRDYLVCSKGHAGPALYAALALLGFFPREWLKRLNVGGTPLPGHCDRKVPGIDATTGSLGQGLSIAAGIARGLQLQGREGQRVFCITGDGEHAEGQIWEAAAFAAHFGLRNLTAFLDWNKMQIDGSNDEVMTLGDAAAKYRAFGWYAQVVDGADGPAIRDAIRAAWEQCGTRPVMLVLDVKKGQGVPNIEALENNHCIGVPKEMAERALAHLTSVYSTCSEMGGMA